MKKHEIDNVIKHLLTKGGFRKKILSNYERVQELETIHNRLYKSNIQQKTLEPFVEVYAKDREKLNIIKQKKYANISVGDLYFESKDPETKIINKLRMRVMAMSGKNYLHGLIRFDIEVDTDVLSSEVVQFAKNLMREFQYHLQRDLDSMDLELKERIGDFVPRPQFENIKGTKNVDTNFTLIFGQ